MEAIIPFLVGVLFGFLVTVLISTEIKRKD